MSQPNEPLQTFIQELDNLLSKRRPYKDLVLKMFFKDTFTIYDWIFENQAHLYTKEFDEQIFSKYMNNDIVDMTEERNNPQHLKTLLAFYFGKVFEQ